jgi:hypothetical protein
MNQKKAIMAVCRCQALGSPAESVVELSIWRHDIRGQVNEKKQLAHIGGEENRPGGGAPYHQLILPIDTVAVRPETRRSSAGTLSSLMRTGTRCANLTQLKVGLTDARRSLLVLRF